MKIAISGKGGPGKTTIPYDEKVTESSLIPQAPLDFCPDALGVTAVTNLAAELVG